MIRRKHSLSLRRETVSDEEDVNPNSYLTNLADCMLVMSVGLLVALVTYFGLDLQKEEEPNIGYEINLDEYEQIVMDEDGDGEVDADRFEPVSGFEGLYREKSTGRYVMKED